MPAAFWGLVIPGAFLPKTMLRFKTCCSSSIPECQKSEHHDHQNVHQQYAQSDDAMMKIRIRKETGETRGFFSLCFCWAERRSAALPERPCRPLRKALSHNPKAEGMPKAVSQPYASLCSLPMARLTIQQLSNSLIGAGGCQALKDCPHANTKP